MQRHRYRGKFPMDAPAIANVITMQYHRFYANISMNTSAIANVATTKGHKTKCNKIEDDRKRLYTLIFK